MNIFEKCMKLCECDTIKESETMIPMCISESSNITSPPGIIELNSLDMEWFCTHVYYISDIHLEHKIIKNFDSSVTNEQVIQYIKQIVKNMFTPEIEESLSSYRGAVILFGGDISSDFELGQMFYTEFMRAWKRKIPEEYRIRNHVFAVLGNHEFWYFNNINDCYEAYESMFKTLDIELLNNNYKITNGIIIVGGTGFAGYNPNFNADNGIYRNTLTRKDEIEETLKWGKTYKSALQRAREENSALVILTHNPISDWKDSGIPDNNCIYFNGHNHRNDIQCDDERNIHVFSDNQVGYYNTKIQFKEAYVYERINPFATYNDGVHEITSDDYLKFYQFMRGYIEGNRLVEKRLKNDNGHFYMIKHEGYYGFFLETDKGTYICVGGRIRKINKHKVIDYIDKNFLIMIQKYIDILYPYRKVQEQIAAGVKAFGGKGEIHGCIIDIDFYNHIMLNPNDGTITYYHSPMLGIVEKHNSLLSLLESHNDILAEQYRKMNASKIETTQVGFCTETIKIDIKNSLYKVSRELNQLQRLFDKKVLRDWNDELLLNV